MDMSYRRGFSGMALVLLTATATASPLVLNTEQKAAAGVSTVFFASHDAPHSANYIGDNVRQYADRALKIVQAEITPAGLMNARGGITINCATAGTLHARMARELPHALKLQWNGCVMARAYLQWPRGHHVGIRHVCAGKGSDDTTG